MKVFIRLQPIGTFAEEAENAMLKNRRQISEYIAAIIANGFILFALNNLYNWGLPFLTENYRNCLWAINVSLVAVIIVNFVFIFFDRNWFKHLLQVFTSAASFTALFVIHAIFPFEFPGSAWYLSVKIFLIVAMVATGASVVYNIIRTIIPDRLKA